MKINDEMVKETVVIYIKLRRSSHTELSLLDNTNRSPVLQSHICQIPSENELFCNRNFKKRALKKKFIASLWKILK